MRLWTAFVMVVVVAAVAVVGQQDPWAAISQQIPSCALPCLNQTRLNSTCAPTDTGCVCGVVMASPLMKGCAMQSCNMGDALGTTNGTATACNVPVRDKGALLYVVTTALCAIALACIFMRLLGAPTAQKKWTQVADDWYMIGNTVLLVGMMVCTILIHHNNYGRDIWALTTGQIRNIMILIYNLEIYYTLINMLTKLSILGFYLRFFPFVVFPGLRTAIYITIAITVASGISFTMSIVFQCTPISFFWSTFDDPPPVGSCTNINVYGWTVASFNFALDFWLLALPMPELLKLRLPPRKKVVVCLMFAVGSFVTIVTIPRLMSMAAFKNTTNPTYDLYEVSLWGHVEATVCVILACIPRISILFMRISRNYSSRRSAENLQSDSSAEQGSGNTLGPFKASESVRSASHPGMSQAGKSHLFGRVLAGD
ncbi:hypothetical protein MFIFM68171_06247 [Madurella fahalii]|uniref:CFEM domain-containing protein n=1 Tax=Madurella fahalii TaxID=1157608 RepID=A0ABQ0GE53_9PEZI